MTARASLLEALRFLASAPTLSPRPWELIYDEADGRRFDGSVVANVPQPKSLRIVDAENRLLVRIAADPEQALKAEDMQLIVEVVNSLPLLLENQ